MWKEFWGWVTDQYIYNTVVTVAVIIIIVNYLKRHKTIQRLGAWFGRWVNKYKKIKVGSGGVELERHDEHDSEKDRQQDEILDSIREEIKKINKRLDVQYGFIREAVVNAGVAVVWAGTKPPFEEAIWAALNNIKLGENGNLVTRVPTIVMEEGKNGVTNYRSVLNRFIKENFTKPEKPIPEHFTDTTAEIDKHIK